jgi:phage minor structural protein
MLEITTLSGESELLANYNGLTRNQAVNGNRSLSFLLPRTETNQYAFDLVDEETIVTDQSTGDQYRIKSIEERVVSRTPVKSVVAPHVFFDLVDEYRYTTLTNGYKSLNELLSFIFTGTDWSFTVVDSYDTAEFENFGNDNCLALFNKVLDRFGAEFDLNGNEVIIRNQIGVSVDLQFRYNHNVKTFKKKLDSSNLSTYIRGTGKQNEDGTYVVEAEYTSPNASAFGIRHAPPYSNESITSEATLLRNMKRALQDTPELTIELDFAVLKDAGYLSEKPGLGDVVPTIYEPLNIDLDLRVMEIEDYPESNKAPRVTLATTKQSYAKAMMNYQKSLLDKIYDENSGRLRYNVYDEAVKRATEALNNSLTELEYPEGMGIIARDKNNPEQFVAIRGSGIGLTTDGGLTFEEAITALGINTKLLTAGQIKTNNIQIIGNSDLFYWDGTALMAIDANDPNKYVKLNSGGLYIARGSVTIERPDGFKLVNNGTAEFDLNIQGGTPQYVDSALFADGTYVVTNEGPYTRTASTGYVRFDYFRLRHTSRYAHFAFYAKGGGDGAYAYVRVIDNNGVTLATNMTNSTTDANIGVTIDMGVPTGQEKLLYAEIKSTSADHPCLVRLATKYMTG